MVSTAALLTKLLYDMSQIYGQSFTKNQSKILISAILGGAHAHWINHYGSFEFQVGKQLAFTLEKSSFPVNK